MADNSSLSASETTVPKYRATSDVIIVPVTVTDEHGAKVVGLHKQDFRVLDNRRMQLIQALQYEDAPCEIGLVLDASESLRHSLAWEKAVARALLESPDLDEDHFSMTVASSSVEVAEQSLDSGYLERYMRQVRAGGWTALIDAIQVAANRLSASSNTCRALVVFSDGVDNHSRWSRDLLINYLTEANVAVYAVVVKGTLPLAKGAPFVAVQNGARLMANVAELSGGASFTAENGRNPTMVANTISSALLSRYMIFYSRPPGVVGDKWHRIQVQVHDHRLHVHARSGYVTR